jgi:hypothetical protein
LDGDIVKAYDYTRHDRIYDALLSRGVPYILAAGILREVVRPKAILKLGQTRGTKRLTRSRAIWQGDPMAPKLFNITLDGLAVIFDKEAQRRRWGWPIDMYGKSKHICLVLFADNYWIVATSPKELQEANRYWQDLLLTYGWHTPVADTRYGTTAEDFEYLNDITYNDIAIPRVSRAVGFKALGTYLTFVTRHDVEFNRRINSAWGAFNKNKVVLCCKKAPIAQRLKFLQMVVCPALFWCSGSWTLRSDQFTKLRAVQRQMVRRMLAFRRNQSEDVEEFMRRTNRTITNLLERHEVVLWDCLARQYVFRWAGWVARLRSFDPNRLTYHVLLHKNRRWINRIAEANHGRQLHCRCFHVWRWEKLLYSFSEANFPNESWLDMAQSADWWYNIVTGIR